MGLWLTARLNFFEVVVNGFVQQFDLSFRVRLRLDGRSPATEEFKFTLNTLRRSFG